MTINVLIGDIFESKAETLINTVNCVGVMGKGIAALFKKQYPDMFNEYKALCKSGKVKPGVPYLYQNLLGVSIINFPTKDHWRSPSKLEYIIDGLNEIVCNYRDWGITSLAVPPLGCGNGGLDWAVVGPTIYQKLSQLDITVELYAPFGTPSKHLKPDFLKSNVKNSHKAVRLDNKFKKEWMVILEVVNRLENQKYTNLIGRTIFQKICYVITELQIDTGFKFIKGSYGPYSKELKSAITLMSNSNLIQENRQGKLINIKTGPSFIRYRKKYSQIIKKSEKKIEKTVDLFSRIGNTTDAEIIATIFFSARYLKKSQKDKITDEELINHILKWKPRWNNPEQIDNIEEALSFLEYNKWLKIKLTSRITEKELLV